MAIKKKNSLPTSLVVTQSNKIVEARYNLPLGEQRLILTMISKIQPDDEDFKPYRISVSEFADFLGIDKDSAYRECKKTTEKLLTRVLNVDEADGLLQIGWLSSAKYVDGSGMVNLSFDPLLKPYLLQLKSNFTSAKLTMMLSFKSQYTMRIYALLKQYQKLKEREIEIELLRDMLGITKDLHVEYSDFKRHVLVAAQKELAQKADLYFEFDEIKYGRRVGAILFQIFTKELPAEMLANAEPPLEEVVTNPKPSFLNVNLPATPVIDNLLLLVPVQHRKRKTVLALIIEYEKKFDFEYVRRNILYSNLKADKSYSGFLKTALQADWGHDWQLVHQHEQESLKQKTPEIWERQGFNSQKEYDDFMYAQQMERYGKKVSENQTSLIVDSVPE